MRLRLLVAVGIILLLALALPLQTQAATPNVGFHQHVEFLDHPVDGVPIPRSPTTVHGNVKLHMYPGTTEWFRVSDGSTVMQKISFVAGPCDDCTIPFTFTVDFTHWSVGRHELRWSLNDNDADPGTGGGQRQYTTSRFQVCLDSCLPRHDRSEENFTGGGGWYQGHNYVIALLLSPRSSVVPGGSIVVASQYGPAVSLCVFLNPNFHAGSHGTQLACYGGGKSSHTLALSADLVDGDNIVIVSHDGFEAGVLHLKVGHPGYLEEQDWWAKTGLVLP